MESEKKENANNQNEIASTEISALDVAKYLIGLAQRDGNPITNLRLQKLLYYAWGYYWNSFKQYLFKDDIEAWKYGPVVKDVYDEYKIFDGGDIIIDDNVIEENKTKFNQQQQDFFSAFYNLMKKYDTWALVDASHKEKPWKETYNNGKQVISYDLMKEEFADDAFDED